jgi:hypothetical protein
MGRFCLRDVLMRNKYLDSSGDLRASADSIDREKFMFGTDRSLFHSLRGNVVCDDMVRHKVYCEVMLWGREFNVSRRHGSGCREHAQTTR